MIGEARRFEASQEVRDRAVALHVALPEISFAPDHDARLRRVDRIIQADEDALIGGVTEIGLEVPVSVEVASNKPGDNEPVKVSIDPRERSVRILSDMTPTVEERSTEELNRAFWVGCLTLNETSGSERLDLRRLDRARKWRVAREYSRAIAAGLGVALLDDALDLAGLMETSRTSWAICFTGQLITQGVLGHQTFRKYSAARPIVDLIMENNKNRARELASRYPVLSHGLADIV